MTSWRQCFFAALHKNAMLRRQALFSTVLECLMPCLFMLLLSIGYWLSSNTSSPAKTYTDFVVNISSVVYDSGLFCVYAGGGPAALPACSGWSYDSAYFSVGPGWGMSMWTTNDTIADALVGILSELDEPFVIPDLDAYLILQGYVSTFFGSYNPLQKSPKASLSHVGYLALVSPDQAIVNAFEQFCNQISYYCSFIMFNTVFETPQAARDFAFNNGQQLWAILDLSQITMSQLQSYAGSVGNLEALPVSISMNYTATPWTFQTVTPYMNGLGQKEYLLYLASGFLTLQQLATEFLISTAAAAATGGTEPNRFGTTTGINRIAVAPMPTRAYFTSQFLVQSGRFIPLVMTFAFLYGLSRLLSAIVEEKDGKVREALLIMGLPRSAFYASWLVSAMLLNAVACIGSTAVLKSTLFNAVDPVVMWITHYSFSLTIMSMAMLLSVFFSKPRIAAIMGPLIMFAFSVPYYAIPVGTPQRYIYAASLLPCTAYAQAITTFVSFAQNGYDVSFSVIADGDYSILLAWFFMWLGTTMTLLLALYLDLVLPSEHGTQRHPLFFIHDAKKLLMSSRYSGSSNTTDVDYLSCPVTGTDAASSPSTEAAPTAQHHQHHHEPFHPPTDVVVEVRKLQKTYPGSIGGGNNGQPVHAVKGISFSLHHGHIHVLLGHNGAGKSTTINMLVGLVPPTAGDVHICGLSIADALSDVRRHLGYCPQHNIIWPTLTVEQHLAVYARLKSKSWDVEEHIRAALELVQLVDKRHAKAASLSGGQKRKLCVAIALIGDSPFLLLDEPTAGMDVEARRAMWAMLARVRHERCVLLSTHFMDEADLLGDHVLIMSRGELYASGSTMFLKSRLGTGYALHCVLEHEQAVNPFVRRILAELPSPASSNSRHNSAAEKPQRDEFAGVTKRGKEVVIALPSDFVTHAERLFTMLEAQQTSLRLLSYGLTLTTMEDVFMRIATDADAEEQEQEMLLARHTTAKSSAVVAPSQTAKTTTENEAAPLLTAPQVPTTAVSEEEEHPTFIGHLWAFLAKRAHCAKRDRKTLCFQIVMPIAFLCVALLVLLLHPPDQPLLVIDSSMYSDSAMEVLLAPTGASYPSPADPLFPATGTASLEQLVSRLSDGRYLPVMDTRCTAEYNSTACLTRAYADSYNAHALPRYIGIDPVCLNQYYLLSLVGTTASLFHNASAPHSLPEALSVMQDLALRRRLQLESAPASAARVTVSNYPLPLSNQQQLLISSIQRIVSAIFILIPFTFVPANYVSYLVREKACKAKHLQWVAGGSMLAFWVANFIWDLMTFLLTEALCIAVFFIFQRDEFVGDATTFAATFTLFLLYGVSCIPFSYVLSFAFANPSTAQNVTMMGNFFAGFLLVMAAQILSAIPTTQVVNGWLCKFYRAVPAYALGEGIIVLTGRQLAMYITGDDNIIDPFHLLDYNNDTGGFFGGVGTSLIYMGCAAPFFFLLLLFLEWRRSLLLRASLKRVTKAPSPEQLEDYGEEDPDVLKERQHIEAFVAPASGSSDPNPEEASTSAGLISVVAGGEQTATTDSDRSGKSHTFRLSSSVDDSASFATVQRRSSVAPVTAASNGIIVQHLRKEYSAAEVTKERKKEKVKAPSEAEGGASAAAPHTPGTTTTTTTGPLVAVKHLSFGVRTGETFALLGTNGAGKTTTISILTGEQHPTCGDAWIHGKSIVHDMHAARKWIGYCPQFDALLDHMTPREHLTMYCRLRGLSREATAAHITHLLDALALRRYADLPSMSLSGGNKRKLSLGIALIGNTKCILLDEPSAGMDPVARRGLWKSVSAAAQGRSIVLTTHHLEEVEALAERVGIMVRGKMMCIGTLQQLKSKYVGHVVELHASFAPPKTAAELSESSTSATDAATRLEAHLRDALPQGAVVQLVEQHGYKATITIEHAPLSHIFRSVECVKQKPTDAQSLEEPVKPPVCGLELLDYALSQCSLEQVFLRIGLLAAAEDHDDAGDANPAGAQ